MTSNDLGNFHPFYSTMSRFLVMLLLFKQGALNDPKWPWHVQYQKRRPFRSTMSRFWVVTKFCEKPTKWPENDLDMFKDKSTHMHSTYTSRGQKLHLFRSMMSTFKLCLAIYFSERCTERPQKTLTLRYQYRCYIHPWGPIFCPFRSTMTRFWVMSQFCEKCIQWLHNDLTFSMSNVPICIQHPWGPIFYPFHSMMRNIWVAAQFFKVKGTHMHTPYTMQVQIFVHFTLRWAIFEEIEIF